MKRLLKTLGITVAVIIGFYLFSQVILFAIFGPEWVGPVMVAVWVAAIFFYVWWFTGD